MKRTLLKKLLVCLFIAPFLVIIAGLTSCNPNLGKYDSEDGLNDFLDDIDDLKGLYESKKDDDQFEFKSDTYDLEDSITNEYIMQYLACEDSSKQVPFKQFVYIIIPFTEDLKIDSLSLYVKANSKTAVKLEFSAFYFKNSDSCPDTDKLRKMNDADGLYSDPVKENSVATASLSVGNYYDGFVLSGFHQTVDIGESYVTDNCLNVKKNSYLYLRVENNSALNKTTMKPVDISFINLLIRAL